MDITLEAKTLWHQLASGSYQSGSYREMMKLKPELQQLSREATSRNQKAFKDFIEDNIDKPHVYIISHYSRQSQDIIRTLCRNMPTLSFRYSGHMIVNSLIIKHRQSLENNPLDQTIVHYLYTQQLQMLIADIGGHTPEQKAYGELLQSELDLLTNSEALVLEYQ